MNITFHARSVVTEHPDGTALLVGFSDEPEEITHYLLLQRAFEFTDEDVSWGENTYHVEVGGSGFSRYGGVSRIGLYRNHLELNFSPDAIDDLSGFTGVHVTFQIGDDDHFALRNKVSEIFQGTDCFESVDA